MNDDEQSNILNSLEGRGNTFTQYFSALYEEDPYLNDFITANDKISPTNSPAVAQPLSSSDLSEPSLVSQSNDADTGSGLDEDEVEYECEVRSLNNGHKLNIFSKKLSSL